MYNSKVINLLKGFTKEDIKLFGRYLESPLFNKDEKVINLYSYLKKYYPSFDHKNIDKGIVAKKVFSVFKDKAPNRLSYFMSILYKLMEDYLVWQELQEQQAEQEFLLLEAFRKRGKKDFFEKAIDKFEKEIEARPNKDVNYYFDSFRLAESSLKELNAIRSAEGGQIISQGVLFLDKFYFSIKLRYRHGLKTWKQITSIEEDMFLIKPIMDLIENGKFKEDKLLEIYFYLNKFYSEGIEAKEKWTYFLNVKHLFFEFTNVLEEDEKTDLIVALLNYCLELRKIEKTEELENQIADLYQFGIETKILFVDGKILPVTFYNIVAINCEAQRNNWALNFIEDYKQFLPANDQQNMVCLSKALWYCMNEDFDQPLTLLQDVTFDHYYYNMAYRYIVTRCYFDANEEDALMTHLEAFEKYVRRNKDMSEHTQLGLLRFISTTKKILKAKYERGKKEELLNYISETDPLFYKPWLLEKVNSL